MSSDSDGQTGSRCFQLLEAVRETPATFTLWEGTLSVGSVEGSDIHLEMNAVSRRHASLEIVDGRVVVRDLGSKNGTWVNGKRISETTVHPGDEIGFGPAVFRLVEIDPEDAVLAIRSERRGEESARGEPELETGTHVRRSTDEPPTWVSLLDEVAVLIFRPGEPRPGNVVERLGGALGADGALLAELGEGRQTVVLAVVGRAIPALERAEVRHAVEEARLRAVAGDGVAAFSLESPEPLTGAVGQLRDEALTLVLSGRLQHRQAVPPLLHLVLRMLMVAQGQPVHFETLPATAKPTPELVFPDGYVPGVSAVTRALYEQLRQLLAGDIPVLITGETGVGKEVAARTLHGSSHRSSGPFVAVNCAAIPSELLEAELFGIERGVATGVDARRGKFQLAEEGTLFLDEIADMSAGLQAKLLRTLQEMEVHPLGARTPVPVDVRLVSASNTNLQQRIAEGRFRRDLYFRIAGFALRVPPLRERRADIPSLVEHFMCRYAGEIGKPVRGITVKALRLLTEAPWPGNVRELEHEVRRLVYLCPPNQAIDSSMLSDSVLSPTLELDSTVLDSSLDLTIERHTEELERRLITLALARTRGNISRAAKLLGLSRNGLKNRMVRYGIE